MIALAYSRWAVIFTSSRQRSFIEGINLRPVFSEESNMNWILLCFTTLYPELRLSFFSKAYPRFILLDDFDIERRKGFRKESFASFIVRGSDAYMVNDHYCFLSNLTRVYATDCRI